MQDVTSNAMRQRVAKAIDLAALPHVLRAVLDAELAAGNALVAVEHGFPAAPCGAVFKLASPLRSRAHSSGGGISYRELCPLIGES